MFRQNPSNTTVTISSANIAQTIIAANGSRTKLRINNNSSNKFPLFVQFGATATHDSYSQIIMPGGVYESPVDQCPLEYISVLSELAGHTFDVLEYSSGNIAFASLADRPSAADFGVGVCQVGGASYMSDGAAWVEQAIFGRSLVSGTWYSVPTIFRMEMTGDGDVILDSKDSSGNITTNVYATTLIGADKEIGFPYPGDLGVSIMATFGEGVTVRFLL